MRGKGLMKLPIPDVIQCRFVHICVILGFTETLIVIYEWRAITGLHLTRLPYCGCQLNPDGWGHRKPCNLKSWAKQSDEFTKASLPLRTWATAWQSFLSDVCSTFPDLYNGVMEGHDHQTAFLLRRLHNNTHLCVPCLQCKHFIFNGWKNRLFRLCHLHLCLTFHT